MYYNKEKYIIYSNLFRQFYLRTIVPQDIEELRIWKNINRNSFFYNKIIDINQQREWYEKYSQKSDDYILIIEEKSDDSTLVNKIGCIGFRYIDRGTIDVYNVLRGNDSVKNSRILDAMNILINWLIDNTEAKIKCDVLLDNKAITWYEKCGFIIEKKVDNYVIMTINKEKYKKFEVIKEKII